MTLGSDGRALTGLANWLPTSPPGAVRPRPLPGGREQLDRARRILAWAPGSWEDARLEKTDAPGPPC